MTKRTQLEADIQDNGREFKRPTPMPTYALPPTYAIQVPPGYVLPPTYTLPPGFAAYALPPGCALPAGSVLYELPQGYALYGLPPSCLLPQSYGPRPTYGPRPMYRRPANYGPPSINAPAPNCAPPSAYRPAPTNAPPTLVPPRDINFSSSAKTVEHILNEKYCGSGTEEFENSYDAADNIRECIKGIRVQATAADVTTRTKRSALYTLSSIGNMVLEGGDTLGSEVRRKFQYEDCLGKAMIDVVLGLTLEERRLVASELWEEVSFMDEVKDLWGSAKGYSIFEGLEGGLELLQDAMDMPAYFIEEAEEESSECYEEEVVGSEEEAAENSTSGEEGSARQDADVEDENSALVRQPPPASQCAANDESWSQEHWYSKEVDGKDD